MRILHLLDLAEGGADSALACAAIVRHAHATHQVWAIGSGVMPAGAPPLARRIGAPLGRPAMAWLGVRRELERASFDACVCWSEGTLAAARLAGANGVMAVFTRGPRAAGPLTVTRRRDLDRAVIVCFSQEDGAAWRDAGAADVRLAPPVLPLVADAFPTRDAARKELGIGPEERVLALLADPPSFGDARRFAYLAGLLSVGGAPVAAVIQRKNGQTRRAARFVKECGRLWRLVACTELMSALPACDACVADVPVEGGRPLLTVDDASPDLSSSTLGACFAAQLGIRVVLPGVIGARAAVNAGVPVSIAADGTCLSLAAALFPIMDGAGASGPPYRPDGAAAMRVIQGVWEEITNVAREGFPLAGAPATPPVLPVGTLGAG